MGYKVLGYLVWQGGKWYVRRRLPNARRNVAIAGGLGLLAAGGAAALLAVRRANGEQSA